MTSTLTRIAAAACLAALLPHAHATNDSRRASFDGMSRAVISDMVSPSLLRLEFHREWSSPRMGTQHEWFVATFDPRSSSKGQIDHIVDSLMTKMKASREDSWRDAMNRDWRGQFRNRWVRDSQPGRHPAQAWMDRYCVTPVPEPASIPLMLSGAGLLAFVVRRKKQRQAAAK